MKIIIAILLTFSSLASATPLTPPVPPQLQPVAWSIGNWQCVGHYSDLPPFTAAHDDVAVFHVALAVGNSWLRGQYVEISTTNGAAPQFIDDSYTIDALTGLGIRSFQDHNPGQFLGGFTIPDATSVHFTGVYRVHGQEVGFDENLTRGAGDNSFLTDSRVLLPFGPGGTLVPITFHTQTCTRL